MKRVAAVVLAGLLPGWVGGCTLVDQNTFYPGARDTPVIPPPPTPVAAAAVPPGRPPLLVISPGAQPTDYADALRKAVGSARARKAAVVFDVVEMEPPDSAPQHVLGAAAAAVAREIVGAGVPPVQVRLDARPDASAPPREVRVYVR